MDFSLSDNQVMIRDMVREFARNEIAPGAYARDQSGEFHHDLIPKLAETGLLGISIPAEYGGSEMDAVSFAIVVEEVAKVDASVALTLASHNGLGTSHLLNFGSDALKAKFLPELAKGTKLAAWCLTEPGSGSDALGMKTTAVKSGDAWVLNGSKNFITQGSVGHMYVVLAITDASRGSKGVTAFLLEKGMPGFTVGKVEDKLGVRSSDTAQLIFENVKVPHDHVIGEVGQGFVDTMKVLDKGRVIIGAMSLGIGEAALSEATRYAQERTAFGQPISEFQGTQWKLADMATELSAARWLVYRAAWMHDQKRFAKKESSMAKLFASEAAFRACNAAVQVFGGYGYVKEYPVERYLRDIKLCQIGEGTSEIQREVIGAQIIGA